MSQPSRSPVLTEPGNGTPYAMRATTSSSPIWMTVVTSTCPTLPTK